MRRVAALLAAMLVVALSWGAYRWWAAGPTEADVVVLAPKGAGVGRIADALRDGGIIRDPVDRAVFLAGIRISGLEGRLRAGEYRFPPRTSLAQVGTMLAEGLGQVRYFLTVPEGLTSSEIVALVRDRSELTGTMAMIPPEGTLLPETYAFVRGDDREGLIRRMEEAMRRTLEKAWANRESGLPLSSPAEALILASIVEKETGLADERPRVAAVFINRLRRGMPLQSDPTVIYGLTGGEEALGRDLRYRDLRSDHPWNTYTRSGLPRGPIANPGRQSIEAVLRPARTQDLYFVADGTGGHAFAATLAEHNANVAKWRAVRRQRGESAPSALEASVSGP